MESWYFDSLDKGYVSNETVLPSDPITGTKNAVMGWELKSPFSFENDSIMVPGQQSVGNTGFCEVGIGDIMRKQFPHDSVRDVFNNNAGVGDTVSPSMVTSTAVSGDEESSSKVSSSVVDSNSRESPLIDLKLGGFGDNLNFKSSRVAPGLSSAESSTPAKRVRMTSLSSQIAYCQVYGCNKDLSSAKDYHKRHKVCDVHSKTSKVVVNGIEQRFCQQCSRFHLLAEFDDGKRSCRKRLAGHNERRRKPQVTINSSRRSFNSYEGSVGSKFQGTTLTPTSFIFQDILDPSSTGKYETSFWGRHIKVEDGANCTPESENTYLSGHLQQKSVSHPYLFGKQYPPHLIEYAGQGSVCSENINQYPLGNEDLTLYDTASTVQGLHGISDSGCALSLLSSQSQNSTPHPLILPSSSSHCSLSEVSEKLFRVDSFRTGSTGRNHPSAMPMVDNCGGPVNSGFANGVLQGTGVMNVKNRFSCEEGSTIDLLQLSSQLQRVESQRQPGSIKQESEGFCCLKMT